MDSAVGKDERMTVQSGASDAEVAAMRRAIELAARGAATALPNPVVGCVVLSPAGAVVGEGWHQVYGGPHAEVNALAAAGSAARGATAVVTLEPCNHTGQTGPCSLALIDAGITRVVIANVDPNPAAAGGIRTLRDAGIDVNTGVLADEAADVNRVWLTSLANQRPFVTFKAGVTIDGRVAAADGTSKWITSAESRADVHLLRQRVDVMMVGVGTVLTDDPQLTVRDPEGSLLGPQPLRVVVDSRGRTPPTAKVLDDRAPSWMATAALVGADADGRVDLARLLDELWKLRLRHVLLEGGPRLAAAFLDAGLIDEVILYQAPLILGAGTAAVSGGAVRTLAAAHRFELREITRIGQDVKLRYAGGATVAPRS